MITSLSWLKELVNITLPYKELEEGLTSLGLECTLDKQKYPFSDVVIGYVEDKIQHPNADNLSVCKVDIGYVEPVQIVCGAPNVRRGIKVPVIKVGGTLNSGEFKIKKSKLRGESSNGMICSERELGIGESNEGILEIDTKLPVGSKFELYLQEEKDTLFNFELTPNRGDCFSHLGVAREIAILEKSSIKERDLSFNVSEELTSDNIKVKLEDKVGCPRYTARIVKGIKVGPSPRWLKIKIESIGLKSINNIVDAANFVMMDSGHPMHTFDLANLSGRQIIIRSANPNEKMTLLDGTDLELNNHHLIVCDKNKPIALAGIMGSLDSGITDLTKDVLIECAYFKPTVIRKGAKSLDLSTDASKRFERDINFNTIENASNQLAKLIQEIAGGTITKGLVDVGVKTKEFHKIEFCRKKCNKFLGIKLDDDKIKEIFGLLNISTQKKNNQLICEIPTYRNDLQREVDLFEEIARVYGYNNIPEEFSFTSNYNTFIEDEQKSFNILRELSSSNGFLEHYSNSLTSQKYCDLFSEKPNIKLSNPLSNEMTLLRNSLIPGLLDATSINERRQQTRFKLLEIGQVHRKVDELETTSKENSNFGFVWFDIENPHWRDAHKMDIYSAKSDLYLILNKMGCKNLKEKEIEALGYDFALEIKNKKHRIGVLGFISSKVLDIFSINNEVIAFEGDLNKLTSIYNNKTYKFQAISQYPIVTRDIALLVDSNIQSGKLISTIKQYGGDILNKITLFDLYEGKKLGKNKKSIAFSLKFQSEVKTLNDKIIDITINKILNELKQKHGATQR
ncbi:MAG: phenylalanine--tRNA ligase subunit beta [Candidatus Marinimicrobia bacterium]|nr:phenylalanine--tRNA ligase subunit beta [Candidatus Neomarinimicrobiota bacterium]|tara:strand:- start:272 stop:2653 length:2382 start_codon:yes stop_codon:yes gene_type:complete